MSILDKFRDQFAKLAAGEQPNMMPIAPYMSNAPKEPPPATLEEMEAFVAAEIEARLRDVYLDTASPAVLAGELFLPWPAPIVGEGTVSDEPPSEPPWVSSDADGRTRTPEWQESVRERFERRVGAALASTTQQT